MIRIEKIVYFSPAYFDRIANAETETVHYWRRANVDRENHPDSTWAELNGVGHVTIVGVAREGDARTDRQIHANGQRPNGSHAETTRINIRTVSRTLCGATGRVLFSGFIKWARLSLSLRLIAWLPKGGFWGERGLVPLERTHSESTQNLKGSSDHLNVISIKYLL